MLIKQSADSKLKGILDLNKTKSSTYEYEHEHESDQSILDEHVDRVFNEERRHNVSSLSHMDNSRTMSTSFHSGYRTLDTSSNRHHHNYFGKYQNSTLFISM